jgi:hypothetical protein
VAGADGARDGAVAGGAQPGAEGPGGGSVLLLQTLQFAERDRVDAAVVELNYVWRFEKEMMICRALFAVHHRQQLPAMMEDTGGGNANGTVVSSCP